MTMLFRQILLAGSVLASLAGGCASGHREPALGHDAGVTTLVLVNHVEGSLELRRVTVEIDGHPLAVTATPPASESVVLGRLPLAPGDHAIDVRASAVSRAASDSIVALGSSQRFRVGEGPAAVRIELQPDASSAQLVARFTGEGAAIESPIDGPHDDGTHAARCAYMPPTPHAMCLAEVALATASARRDAVRMACVRDKLTRMQAIADKLSRSPSDEARSGADRAIALIAEEMNRCPDSETALGTDGTVVRVVR
jgi:hypothetical protein